MKGALEISNKKENPSGADITRKNVKYLFSQCLWSFELLTSMEFSYVKICTLVPELYCMTIEISKNIFIKRIWKFSIIYESTWIESSWHLLNFTNCCFISIYQLLLVTLNSWISDLSGWQNNWMLSIVTQSNERF